MAWFLHQMRCKNHSKTFQYLQIDNFFGLNMTFLWTNVRILLKISPILNPFFFDKIAIIAHNKNYVDFVYLVGGWMAHPISSLG